MLGPVLEQANINGFSLNNLNHFLDGLIDAAVIVDRNLNPLAWNAAYLQTVGLRTRRFAQLLSDTKPRCCDLFALDICKNQCLAKRCFDAHKAIRMDEIAGISKLHETPQQQTLIVSAMPIEDENGQVVAVLEVYRDVTAEARIQGRYKILLDQERHRAEILEQQVRERTKDLERSLNELKATKAQLVQSEKLSSLGQLVAGIAHEINNPINFIYGNTDFLQSYVAVFQKLITFYEKSDLPENIEQQAQALKKEVDFAYIIEDTGRLIESIRNGAERATAIIRDLRRFIHGGSEQRAVVTLPRCLDTTLNLLSHEIKGRITIVRRYADKIPAILGNEGQLNQVFMNLLVNAIQAIEKHGTITLVIEHRDGGVALDVIDTGIGLTEQEQLKVFDPFFTTKPVGEGTGLGLSISYSIVDGHGGKISLKSEKGKGTTFTVWLPVYEPIKNPEETFRPTGAPAL